MTLDSRGGGVEPASVPSAGQEAAPAWSFPRAGTASTAFDVPAGPDSGETESGRTRCSGTNPRPGGDPSLSQPVQEVASVHPSRAGATSTLCACGKPAVHVDADPDSSDWACRVPTDSPVADSFVYPAKASECPECDGDGTNHVEALSAAVRALARLEEIRVICAGAIGAEGSSIELAYKIRRVLQGGSDAQA